MELMAAAEAGAPAACLDEYEELVIRMNTPRIVIDNGVSSTATVVKVDSSGKQRVLFDVVRLLTDLDLVIRKAYISSDGFWFMDVFHVTDRKGRKLTDSRLVSFIEESASPGGINLPKSIGGATTLELTGSDRPGLLSEVFAVISDLRCGVVDAKVWTHAGRIASVLFLNDEDTGSSLEDPQKIRYIEARLRRLLGMEQHARGSRAAVLHAAVASTVHPERRLHRMMFEDRDYQRSASCRLASASCSVPSVAVHSCSERGYSAVSIQCRDRANLLFDLVCALTDMEYVVFHGTINTDADHAYMEFYIRHSDGTPISSEAERHRVIQCLQASIERRASEGLRLELCTMDHHGLLAGVTRTFRENGLSVVGAEISTKGQMARNVFYVKDATGQPADTKMIDAVRQRIGAGMLKVGNEPYSSSCNRLSAEEATAAGGSLSIFSIGSLVMRNLCNLGLIKL